MGVRDNASYHITEILKIKVANRPIGHTKKMYLYINDCDC
jgi:hypothetical protein